jgi:hypothetical protein
MFMSHNLLPSGKLICPYLVWLIFLTTLNFVSPTNAQETSHVALDAQANVLTKALLDLNTDKKKTRVADHNKTISDMLGLVQQRQKILADLVQDHPDEMLKLALSEEQRTRLPAKVQEMLEQPTSLEGSLRILHLDYSNRNESHYLQILETDQGERYSVHFSSGLRILHSGVPLRVSGLLLIGVMAKDTGATRGSMVIDDTTGTVEVLAAGSASGSSATPSTTTTIAPSALGAQKTLVILVNFQDNRSEPYTPTDARNVVFGSTGEFFRENSYQQTWLDGDVVGWLTIAMSSTVCDPNLLASQAQSAATAAGVNIANYKHLVFASPKGTCGWWGLSDVGGNPSLSWVNGAMELGVTAHELGHGFGLWHSHSLYCGLTSSIGSNCSNIETGDIVDVMGTSETAHFNAFQKERLGWLNTSVAPITTVLSDGTYVLSSFESAETGPKALKILKSIDPITGKRTWYYVEARKPIGFDAFITQTVNNIIDGVLIHIGTDDNGNSSSLIDMTPTTPVNVFWFDPALTAGQSLQDPSGGVKLTSDWATVTGAAVTVRFGSQLAVATNAPSYTRGQSVTLNASFTTAGLPVGSATVTFTVTKPNGAIVTAKTITATNGIAAYKLRLAKQDPIGAYHVGTVANKNTLSATGATNFIVQ